MLLVQASLVALPTLLAASICGSAQPSEYEIGTSLLGDMHAQAERLVALLSRDAQAAVHEC
jgi:hypothetical protein